MSRKLITQCLLCYLQVCCIPAGYALSMSRAKVLCDIFYINYHPNIGQITRGTCMVLMQSYGEMNCDWLHIPITLMYIITPLLTSTKGARWPSGLECWLGLATGWSWPGSNPAAATSLRNIGKKIPFTLLCQCLS